MNTEKLLAEVQECRGEMHRVVDARFDLIVECIRSGKPLPKPDTVLPLSTAPSRFKRSKPVAVIFPDGRRLEVTKWKAAVTAIFQECANTTWQAGKSTLGITALPIPSRKGTWIFICIPSPSAALFWTARYSP